MKVHTRSLTGSTALVISASDNVIQISLVPQASSSCTVNGSLPFGGQNSSAVTVGAGISLTVTSPNGQSPLDGLTITNVSGTTDIIISVQ